MVAFKLVRRLSDGSLSPLFINKKMRLPIGEWMKAELKPTKGYKVRKGWHCTLEPNVPHLSTKGRVWVMVEVRDFEINERPISQGGKWIIAQEMRILNTIER